MKNYKVTVGKYDREFPTCYSTYWETSGPLEWSDALRVFNEIVLDLPDGEGERWFNENGDFEAYEWFSKRTIKLPIKVTLDFYSVEKRIYDYSAMHTYEKFSGNKVLGRIKESVVETQKHLVLFDKGVI